jgi:hypothetical protein
LDWLEADDMVERDGVGVEYKDKEIRARDALLCISELGRCPMTDAQVDVLVLKQHATSLE